MLRCHIPTPPNTAEDCQEKEGMSNQEHSQAYEAETGKKPLRNPSNYSSWWPRPRQGKVTRYYYRFLKIIVTSSAYISA